MGKNIISISMSGPLADDIMDQEVRRLCDEHSIDFLDFFAKTGQLPSIEVINQALEEEFPGELKLIK